jgi:hypothetical protein
MATMLTRRASSILAPEPSFSFVTTLSFAVNNAMGAGFLTMPFAFYNRCHFFLSICKDNFISSNMWLLCASQWHYCGYFVRGCHCHPPAALLAHGAGDHGKRRPGLPHSSAGVPRSGRECSCCTKLISSRRSVLVIIVPLLNNLIYYTNLSILPIFSDVSPWTMHLTKQQLW